MSTEGHCRHCGQRCPYGTPDEGGAHCSPLLRVEAPQLAWWPDGHCPACDEAGTPQPSSELPRTTEHLAAQREAAIGPAHSALVQVADMGRALTRERAHNDELRAANSGLARTLAARSSHAERSPDGPDHPAAQGGGNPPAAQDPDAGTPDVAELLERVAELELQRDYAYAHAEGIADDLHDAHVLIAAMARHLGQTA